MDLYVVQVQPTFDFNSFNNDKTLCQTIFGFDDANILSQTVFSRFLYVNVQDINYI